jgi:hypothetical protein
MLPQDTRSLGCDRVKFLDGCLIVLWSEMGVPDSHADGLVAGKFLYCSQIDALHHQTTDERVPKAMPRKVAHPCIFDAAIKPSSRIVEVSLMF